MTIKARAALLHGINQTLVIEDVELDEPRAGEVLVEIKAAGICHSDLHLIEGHIPTGFPALLGHEAGGVVVRCGPGVTSLAPGDHVLPLFAAECRACAGCTSGKTNMCSAKPPGFVEGRFTYRGQRVHQGTVATFATHTVVEEISLAKIRSDAPLDRAFYIGCGVTTGVGAAVFTADVKPGSSVIVFGMGGIGLNVVQGAQLAGATRIIGVDINPDREEMARSFGATDFVNPRDGDVVERLIALTSGGADYVFEAIGSIALMEQSIAVANPSWGMIVIVGLSPFGETMAVSPWNLLLGQQIKGSWFGGAKSRTDVPRIVDWYMAGRIKIDPLVTHSLPFERINEGFDLLRSGQTIRTVLTFD